MWLSMPVGLTTSDGQMLLSAICSMGCLFREEKDAINDDIVILLCLSVAIGMPDVCQDEDL